MPVAADDVPGPRRQGALDELVVVRIGADGFTQHDGIKNGGAVLKPVQPRLRVLRQVLLDLQFPRRLGILAQDGSGARDFLKRSKRSWPKSGRRDASPPRQAGRLTPPDTADVALPLGIFPRRLTARVGILPRWIEPAWPTD